MTRTSLLLGFAALLLTACAADDPGPRGLAGILNDLDGPVTLRQDEATGQVRFLLAKVPVPDEVGDSPEEQAQWFLGAFAMDLGIEEDFARHAETRATNGSHVVSYDLEVLGVPVYGSEIKIGIRNGAITSVISNVPNDLSALELGPYIDGPEGKVIARASVEGGQTRGLADLVWLNVTGDSEAKAPTLLAWKVDVEAGRDSRTVFVDANEGHRLGFGFPAVLEARPRTHEFVCSADGSTAPPRLAYDENADAAPQDMDEAARAHRYGTRVLDYFQGLGVNSYDGNGAVLNTVVGVRPTSNCSAPGHFAYWDGKRIEAGASNVPGKTELGLDIYAHEFTHALLEYHARQDYEGESGAINESLADTFGAFVDDTRKWEIDEEAPSGVVRTMNNPFVHGHPTGMANARRVAPPLSPTCTSDTDCGPPDPRVAPNVTCAAAVLGPPVSGRDPSLTCYSCDRGDCRREDYGSADDHGFVHINSSIPNLVAYRITEGEAASTPAVDGIGQAKAERLYIDLIQNHLVANSNFAGLRSSMHAAASVLVNGGGHGFTFNDCGSVLNAFASVGIGEPDSDSDCVADPEDNCPNFYNPAQEASETCDPEEEEEEEEVCEVEQMDCDGPCTVADAAAGGACSTAHVEGLSDQLFEALNCYQDPELVDFGSLDNVELSCRTRPYLQQSARDALLQAASQSEEPLVINSAYRTIADQFVLWASAQARVDGRNPRGCKKAAEPGDSRHQSGLALDVRNGREAGMVRDALQSAGCAWHGGGDPIHYTCSGEMVANSAVRAFQDLWNLNNPDDMIEVDGNFGPTTQARLERAPLLGFEQTGCPEPECRPEGERCGGSGPDFDDECCGESICVAELCVAPGGRREEETCDNGSDCARGLWCGWNDAGDAGNCCVRGDDYCESSADCCGKMTCNEDNRCVQRGSGEACWEALECSGSNFCTADAVCGQG